jgi:hypothetical protein
MNTLKTNQTRDIINRFVSNNGDISGESKYNRRKIIAHIYQVYKKNYPDDYLGWIANDIVKHIGYYVDLKEKNDVIGMTTWSYFNKYTMTNLRDNNGDFIINETGLEKILYEMPLYYLMAFLGQIIYDNEIETD